MQSVYSHLYSCAPTYFTVATAAAVRTAATQWPVAQTLSLFRYSLTQAVQSCHLLVAKLEGPHIQILLRVVLHCRRIGSCPKRCDGPALKHPANAYLCSADRVLLGNAIDVLIGEGATAHHAESLVRNVVFKAVFDGLVVVTLD